MQAHANDLRSEVENDWDTLTGAASVDKPDGAALDAFVHQAVREWRRCPLRPAVVALLEFAEKVTRTPAGCAASDIAALRQAGWSDTAIHDAVQVIAYFNYINRIADALGVALEDGLPTWGTSPST